MNLLKLHKAIQEKGIVPLAGIAIADESAPAETLPVNSLIVEVGETPLRFDFDAAPEAAQVAALRAFLANWTDTPEPNWSDFLDDLARTGCYGPIARSEGSAILVGRILRLSNGGASFEGAADPLVAMWNAAPPALNAQQRDGLRQAAASNHVPLMISDNNSVSIAP